MVPIGNTPFVRKLLKQLPRHTDSVSAQDVIKAGATRLQTLTHEGIVLRAIQTGYGEAVVATLYLRLAVSCASLPFAAYRERKSVKPDAMTQEGLEKGRDAKPESQG